MAFQFLHFDLVARSVSKKSQTKRWTVSEVLAEAARLPDACPHVVSPREPALVSGMELPEVERHATAIAGEARDVSGRRLRKDAPILLAGVASYPIPLDRMSESDWQDFRDWEWRTVGWLYEHFGQNVASVVRHEDESHPHVHFFVLPELSRDQTLNIKGIHRGVAARESAKAEGASTKAANRAYCAAMRSVQDDFHRAVGVYHGHLREGPRRKRLTRSAYLADQREAQMRAEMMRKVEIDLLELEKLRIDAVAQDRARKRASLLDDENKRLRDENEGLERSLKEAHKHVATLSEDKARFQAAAKHSAQVVFNLIGLVVRGDERFRAFLLGAKAPWGLHHEIWGRLRSFLFGNKGPSDGVERSIERQHKPSGHERHRYRGSDPSR